MATTNPDQTVLHITETPAPTHNVSVNIPTNYQPTSTNIMPVDEPKPIPPSPTNTAAVNKPLSFTSTPTNTAVVDKPSSFSSTPVGVGGGGDKTPLKLEEDAALAEELKKIEEQFDDKKVAGALEKFASCAICCGSSFVLICLGIAAIIPLLQLIIGMRHADDCPINWHIPHYLVVAGACGLTGIGLSVLQIVLGICGILRSNKSSTAVKCAFKIIPTVTTCLNIFLLGWFIAGCVWVFGAWGKVQYNHPDQANFCQSTTYRFAYWLLLLSILYHVLTCCSTCAGLFPKAGPKRKGQHTAVPTTEP